MYILVHSPEKLYMFGTDDSESISKSLNFDNQLVEKSISENPSFDLHVFSQNKLIIEAAGGLIINQKNELLMIYRKGYWDLPKGKLDPGETMEECAIREVKEETGLLNIQLIKSLHTTYHTYPIQEKIALKPSHWFLMEFNGTEKPVPQTEEDITEIRWVNKSEAKQLLPLMYASIREMVLIYFL